MKVFTVHAPPCSLGVFEQAERMRFVKDGFCWPALFIAFIWLLWHRLWLVLIGWLAIGLAIGLIGQFVPAAEPFVTPAAIVYAVVFAMEANALRRWTLERHGWRFIAVATGRNREEAEYSFFQRWLEDLPPARARSDHAGTTPAGPARDEEPVIGLFPQPG